MTSLLALAAVGSWTYAGFLAEPTPTVPTPPQASAPDRPIAPEVERPEVEEPEVDEPEPKAPSPSTMAPAGPPARPTLRYRLADARGQHWEHADPEYLRKFVVERNLLFDIRPHPSPARRGP